MTILKRSVRMLLLGAPGSGKGTQTSRLLKKFHGELESVSSGDLLRKNIAERTQIGLQVQKIISEGKLVPDQTIINLIEIELKQNGWLNPNSTWLLDGFPRTRLQAEALDKFLSKYDAELNFVVDLQVPEKVILDRIENRYVHIPSGRVYNLTYNPPKVPGKDDITGEPLSKRPDDNPAIFKKRIDAFKKDTAPLIDYYKSKNNIFYEVAGETSDIIYPKLEAEILKRFA